MKPLLYQTITSVHLGEGSSVTNISLPLVRERHTRWPYLPGSGLKGALRNRARFTSLDPKQINAIFGIEAEKKPQFGTEEDTEPETGTLRITGATLLALPVRSLKTSFLLVTCPMALSRFARMFQDFPAVPFPAGSEVLAPTGLDIFVSHTNAIALQKQSSKGMVVLEEVAFHGRESSELDALVRWLKKYFPQVASWGQLVIVNDDIFTRSAQLWTEVRTHAAIDASGVVKDGQLYQLESLPPETLLMGEIDPETWGSEGLPGAGEAWVVGGHKTSGLGRLTWYGRQE